MGCSNNNQIDHYISLEIEYHKMLTNTNFIIDDMEGLLESGIVLPLDGNKNPPFEYRKATIDDRQNANQLIENMELLKINIEAILEQSIKINQLLRKKNIFNGSDIKKQLDIGEKFIQSCQSDILKITGGLKPLEYINQYVPKGLK